MLTPTERQAIIDEIEGGTFDLEDALDDIATEQRGEGVRRAIYGGILLLNEEGKAGAVDVKARQKMELMKTDLAKQLSAMEKQMGQFIANNSGTVQATKITETRLFASSSPSKDDSLTVSDDVSQEGTLLPAHHFSSVSVLVSTSVSTSVSASVSGSNL